MSRTANSKTHHTQAHLRILATSDVHMHMTGWNARQDYMARGVGLDQLAPTIHAARSGARGLCLLFDNGDILQGTTEGDLCAQACCDIPHPWPGIADALGYDAVGLGNHDFDYGLPFLERIVDQIKPPVLCASLSQGHIAGVAPSALLHRRVTCADGVERPICIGVTSVLPPQTLVWNHQALTGRLAFDSGVVAAGKAVDALRRDKADVIVLLCHSGLSGDADPDAENFAAQVGAQVPGIDAMIMGHTHRRFPGDDPGMGDVADAGEGTIAGVPSVMPGFSAQTLGLIDLDLGWSDTGWQVAGHKVALLDAAQDQTDPSVTDLAAPIIAATRQAMAVPLTTTGHHIHSYFNALQSGTDSVIVARAMMQAMTRHVAGGPLADLPMVAAVASPAAGGHSGVMNFVDIPEGPVLARHAAMICPYPNQVWAAVLTGAALRTWMERSAAYFGPRRGALSPLANSDAPAFNFDTLVGMETEIDPFAPPRFDVVGHELDPKASRVRALRHNGVEVGPQSRFVVAMTSYRGAGGGRYPGLDMAQEIIRTEADLTAAVRDVFRAAPLGDTAAASAWRFVPGLGAQVMIETSPKAADHLSEIARFDPQPLGLSAAGFLKVRVTL